MNRNKVLRLNTVLTLLSEVLTFVSGLILPRLMLLHFGSDGNGLVSSITQFLSFSAILRAGMGGAIRAALYKPLANKDKSKINSIMAATSNHMNKIGAIVGICIIVFSFIYPSFVKDSYGWFEAFSLVLIIGSGTFADNFFGIKYKILLQADQKYYIQIGFALITNCISVITSIILIEIGCSIHMVKLGAMCGNLLNPLLLSIYVNNHYSIKWNVEPDNIAIKERWNAFAQQVAYVVNSDVDLTILTLIATLKDVSVYTVHFMVVSNIGKIVDSFTSGINSTFGDMIAKNERQVLKDTFFALEWKLTSIAMILYSVTAVMLPRFVELYTRNVTDINYIRPVFAFCMVITTLINTTRIPYQLLSEAAGRFRETRNGAIIEVVVNVIISLIMTFYFGVIGVLIGTLIAGTVRTFEYCSFSLKHILQISRKHLIKLYGVLFLGFGTCFVLGRLLTVLNNDSYFLWIGNSIISLVVSFLVCIFYSFLFYSNYLYKSIRYIRAKCIIFFGGNV